jgi:hypothetical protein
MKRLTLAMLLVVGYQQWQIHELRELHEDAGAYIDAVADMVGNCDGHDSCGEWLTYLETDVEELQQR